MLKKLKKEKLKSSTQGCKKRRIFPDNITNDIFDEVLNKNCSLPKKGVEFSKLT